MGYNIKIENIVASGSFDTRIKLDALVKNWENVEYEPEQFPGLVYRIQSPKVALLIFSSGKLVCTGAKSAADVKDVVSKVASKLHKLGFKPGKKFNIKIENIVASATLGRALNLDNIAFVLENTEYEPEQFPGLVYRLDDPKITFLLFGSGKIICTGGQSLASIKGAIEKLDKKLKEISRKE
jgi:transcription initiation factor TFIID TATA-box-binding protein